MSWTDLRQICEVEIEADSEAPDMASFSYTSSRATLVLKLTPKTPVGSNISLSGIIARILGASMYKEGPQTRMVRVLPLQHPMFATMFATEIASFQGRGPLGGVAAWHSALGSVPPAQWQAYEHYRVVVVFTNVKYAVKEDDPNQGSELYRFVERHVQLGIENIVRQGSTFRWVPGVPGFAGQAINQGQILRSAKGLITFVWKNVNYLGLFGHSGNRTPFHIMAGIGRVNESEFAGFAPGKLLLLPPKFIPLEIPFPSSMSNDGRFSVGRGTADLNLAYDIELPMSFIEPPRDPTFNYEAAARAGARDGHNLLPLPPGGTVQFFYPATLDGTNVGVPLYEAYNFHDMFRLWPPN